MAARLGFTASTCCLALDRVTADEDLARLTGFPIGTKLVRALRARYADDQVVSTDDSYILADLASGLTPELVESGIYNYLEGELGVGIATSRRIITVEAVTEADQHNIDLDGFNAVGVMRSHTFDTEGIMLEYTETHERPDFFSQYTTVPSAHSVRPNSPDVRPLGTCPFGMPVYVEHPIQAARQKPSRRPGCCHCEISK